jgi:hypothetical protein
VAGAGIYFFVRTLENTQAQNMADRNTVLEQVLVAREAVPPSPSPDMNMRAMLEDRIEALKREDPERYGGELHDRDLEAVEKQVIAKWHSIPPGDAQTYMFRNVRQAQPFTSEVQLRLKPRAAKTPSDEKVRLAIWLNGRPFNVDFAGYQRSFQLADDNFHVIRLPLSAMNEQGDMVVTLRNIDLDDPEGGYHTSVSFDPGKGLEMLYRVDNFERNYIRGLAMIWVKLGFLAVLGLMAGTFLGFPVACLLTLMIYFTAGASEFLIESLRFYAGASDRNMATWDKLVMFMSGIWSNLVSFKIWSMLKMVIRMFGEMFVAIVPAFSRFNPVPDLSDGRLVSYREVASAVVWVGVVYSGICGLVAWAIFRRRELARVTV